jgi:hypothetical protein
MIFGCSQQPSGTAAMIEDKTYTVTPAAVTVKAGIVTGEVTEMKVRATQGRGAAVLHRAVPGRYLREIEA